LIVPQSRQQQLLGTDTLLFHTVETIHSYLVETRDCTTKY